MMPSVGLVSLGKQDTLCRQPCVAQGDAGSLQCRPFLPFVLFSQGQPGRGEGTRPGSGGMVSGMASLATFPRTGRPLWLSSCIS